MPGKMEVQKSSDDDAEFDSNQLACIQELRQLIEKQPRLVIRTHNRFMARFLYRCDWNVQKSFDFLFNGYKFRAANPKFFLYGPLSKLDHLIQGGCKFLLENRDKNGRAIFVNRLSQYFSAKNFYEITQMDDLVIETILDDPESQKNGVSIIIDVKDAPFGLVKWLTPKLMKVTAEKSEWAPIKVYYHVINTNTLLNAAISLLFKFMSAEAQKNVTFHYNNLASLQQAIGIENLPPMYGGTGKEIDIVKLCNKLYEKESILLDYMIQGWFDPEPEGWNHELV